VSYPKWRHYPSWRPPGPWVTELTLAVAEAEATVSSELSHLKSNEVLELLRPGLELRGFAVERAGGKLPRPVLYGDEGTVVKSFNVDAFRSADGVAVEVESGSAVYNNRILLDMLKFSLGADVSFGAILLPLKYATAERAWQDPYPGALKLFDAIFANPERFRISSRGSPDPRLLATPRSRPRSASTSG
jgi:hypothetical protein